MLRDAARNESVDVTYISGSGTPGGGNPTFRVFHYDTETYELRDYDQYWASLTAANAAGAASWVKDHSARAYYSLADLSAPEWERLASSWLTGDDQMQTWQVQCMWMRRLMAPPTSLLSWILGFLLFTHACLSQNYARAISRDAQPVSSQNRKEQACTSLSVQVELYQACMNDPAALFATDHSHSRLPKALARELVSSVISTLSSSTA